MNRGLATIAVMTLSSGIALVMAGAPAHAAGLASGVRSNAGVRFHRGVGWHAGGRANAAAKAHPAATSDGATATASPTDSASAGGDLTTSLRGVPAQVPVGGGFTATVTVTSTSAYYVVVEDLYLGMWNLAQSGDQTKGITVTWDDPASGTWRASDEVDSNGGWGLVPDGQVEIQPHGTLVYQVRVSMGGGAKQGVERVDCNGVSAWTLVDASGDPVPGQPLLGYYQAQTSFTYGSMWRSGMMGSTSTPIVPTSEAAAPAAPAEPAQTSQSPRALWVPAKPSPSPSSHGTTSAAVAPSAAQTSAPPPSAAPPKADSTVTDVSGNSVVPVAFVGLLIVTGIAAGTLSARRLRRQGDDDISDR